MRILFLTSTRIGDAVLSTGALAWLLDRHPAATVTVACGAAPAPLFRRAPGVERVLAIVKRPGGGHWLRLWRDVAGRRWDLVVDLRGSVIAWTLRADHRIVHRPDPTLRHRIVQISELMGAPHPLSPRLWIDPAAHEEAAHLLPPARPVLALAPSANWEQKRWPGDRFAGLAHRLTRPEGPLAGARIAVFGAAEERADLAPLLSTLPTERTVDLIGRGDLRSVAACLARADLFVGNDSGLMHIAAATGAPTLGLFGPSRTEHYAPWGPRAAAVRTAESYEELAARPAFSDAAGGSLMTGLAVERVEAEAIRLLGNATADVRLATPL